MLGRTLAVSVLGAALAAFCANASASIGIATGPFATTGLRVDANGDAEVSWVVHGTRDSVVIPPAGQLYHGTLPGPDVSRPTSSVVIPYHLALRRTPDGRLWALQAWQTSFSNQIELRFSRWIGAPTRITLAFKDRGPYRLLAGRATFHGRPVTGTYRTNSGTLVPLAVELDCFACPAAHGAHWDRFNGIKTAPDGSFSSGLQAAWQGARFRASISGPDIGWTLAPDAAATLRAG